MLQVLKVKTGDSPGIRQYCCKCTDDGTTGIAAADRAMKFRSQQQSLMQLLNTKEDFALTDSFGKIANARYR